MKAHEIIRRPIISEKGMSLINSMVGNKKKNTDRKQNTYPFEVDLRANKIQIGKAIEELFSVKVVNVRTMVCHAEKRRNRSGGYGRSAQIKKAYVTLHKDNSIEFV